ncbi:MAG: hypothetical protein J6B46_06230 [Parabacteroides sp.]|nr:hypothetical protein [Parabacteroides sp.]MBQ8530085.1 hypothetical protein [Parabacteroides sp.]
MDLEKMKLGWDALNERLERNEVVNQKIIKEMISAKTKSAYSHVYRNVKNGLWAIIFNGGVILPIVYMQGAIKVTSFAFLESVLLVGFLYQIYMMYVLSNFNLETKRVDEIMHFVLTYKKLYLYNLKYGIALVLFTIGLFFVLQNTFGVYSLVAVVIFLIISMIIGYIQNRSHRQQIKELEFGLEELREFEQWES